VRDLPDSALIAELADAKEELFKLRFQLATGQQENTSRVGHVKRQIARINTVLREREIAAAEALENANG
jgi:large subunit ribosomal protein L29